jgi:cytochrome c-type protein NapB
MKLRNPYPVLVLVFLIVLVQACVGGHVDQTVTDDDLGLSKDSVFSTPDPIVAATTAKEPGENELLGAYFSESPPSISHDIEGLVPIKLDENLCLGCHDLFDEIGNETGPGDPTPMPASHYTDLRRNPDEVTSTLIGARFVCTQCHVPQADAAPLVANTYRQ